MTCPRCHSNHIVKNGFIHNGNQNFKCKDCGRQFVQHSTKKVIGQETRDLIDKLLLERLSLAGIARVTGVSEQWLQTYVNAKYSSVPKTVEGVAEKKGQLTVQCDELWSFVGNKKNKQWIWLALDVMTGEIVGVYVGQRSREGAKSLWKSLPAVYRQCAVCYTDFWSAYEAIFPSSRHRAVSKHSGNTNLIERFNCTLRQRVSRLVRDTLSFSKKLDNHIGAIWYFVHHYNLSLLF
ncbi:IS1 family transposase [Gloeocapsa sp. BRSZ]